VSRCCVLKYNDYAITQPTSTDHIFNVIIWLL